MQKIAVFPGSFDPFTIGHLDIVHRALPLFDKLIIGIGVNAKKNYLFSLDQRINWLQDIFKDYTQVEIKHFSGLTAEFCLLESARYILRGIRNNTDFEYEKTIAQMNKQIGNNLETIFLVARPEFSHISSTVVRELISYKSDVHSFLPEEIKIKY